uniref:hypothetical protein n=1 Tax=Acetatifactor sp. TaxID=1872090 RepID=UPI0040572D5F
MQLNELYFKIERLKAKKKIVITYMDGGHLSDFVLEIAEQYRSGIVACERYKYPEDMRRKAKEIDAWINRHTAVVWEFCLDVLAKYKSEWLTNSINQ